MEIWEIVAREAMRDTAARYAHCADSGRFEDLAALFAEDGTLEIDGRPPLRGRPAIRAFLAETRERRATDGRTPFIRHHVSSVRIDLRGTDEAEMRSYFFVITDTGPDHWGRYRDRFVRHGEQWLLHHRRVSVDGRSEVPSSSPPALPRVR